MIQLACLSTLGGGYFLCNKNETALRIALDLLRLGLKMHNTSLVVRAMTYVAVNLRLMGRKDAYHRIMTLAFMKAKGSKSLTSMCQSTQLWLKDFEAGLKAKQRK